MIHAQNCKYVSLIVPKSVTSQTTVSATVSVVGWDYAEVVAYLDTGSSVVDTLTLTESDGTTYVTATDLAMTTTTGNTSTPDIYCWFCDLRKRKSNLKIVFMAGGAARLASAHVRLSRGEAAPTTAAGRGLAGQTVA